MDYDVIVIGAGVEGSATGYHLANSGKRTLMLEQFDAQHTRGSSHGCSRITRKAYRQPYYVRMMEEAFRLWEEVERKSGKQLYTKTGILVFGTSDVDKVISSLETNGIGHEVLSGAEANRKYPGTLTLPSHCKCVYENDGGILHANKAVGALQHLFQQAGGVLLDNHQVTDIQPGPMVTVVTNRGTFRGRKLVVTAGPWTGKIMAKLGVELPLTVRRIEVYYWKTSREELYSYKNFPVFIAYDVRKNDGWFHIFGLPIFEYPGMVKICYHTGPTVDPDARDRTLPSTAPIVSGFIKEHFKDLSTEPSICELCMYTDTPDEDPVLDRHPVYGNIIVGGGFSGHGFKLAPVMGKILCEMALDLPPSYDLTPFRLDRFGKRKPKL